MKRFFFAALCAASAIMALNSCMGNKAGSQVANVLDAIPADADMVGVADLKLLLNSADIQIDGTQLTLPDYIKNGIPGENLNEFEDLQAEMNEIGVSGETFGMFASFSGERERMFFVWPIADEPKFTTYMETEEDAVSETDAEVTYFYSPSSWDNGVYIESVVKDGYAYFLESGRYFDDIDEAIDVLKPCFTADKSYADTKQGSLILDGNVGGFAMTMPKVLIREMRREGTPSSIANALEGAYYVVNFNLSNDALTWETAVYDANNKPMGLNDIIGSEIPGLALNTGIDSKMLRYLPQNTIAAYAANVEGTNWDELLDWIADVSEMSRSERGTLTMVGAYLNKLGGNIAIGAGFDGGLKAIGQLTNGEANPFAEFTFGAVIQTKPNEAQGLIKELSGVLDMADMPYSEINNGIYMTIPDGGDVYAIAVEDDVIAIANEKITEPQNNAVSHADFGNQILGFILVADKSHRLFQDLGINYGLEMIGGTTANPLRTDGEIRITDNSDKLVTSIVKSIIDIAKNSNKIYSNYFAREYEYVDYDYDYPVVEEVANDSVAYDYAY